MNLVARPGNAIPGLSPAESASFVAGRGLFVRQFTPGEGLGPLFNERGCGNCHDLPAPGGSGVEDVTKATRFEHGTCDVGSAGPVIQRHATPLLERAGVTHQDVPRGATAVAQIQPPALFGLGLLEALSDSTILAREDPQDANHDGIAGRAARTADGRVGRFGRKAEFATLREFVEDAALAEIGLTSPARPAEVPLNGRPLPRGVDPARDPELTEAQVDDLTTFVRLLAPPAPDPAGGPLLDTLARGATLFARTGCAACHVPRLTTGSTGAPPFRDRVEDAYTDLLLHDLGPRDASICSAGAGPGVWRTAPLMGIRFRQRLLHDGRVTRVDEAIRLHGGEARRARDAYEQLSQANQADLIRFVYTR